MDGIFEIRIVDTGVGGDGIGRVDGYAVFVAGALPGDTVEVRLTERGKRFGRGELVRIVRPSPGRVEPLCPVWDRCGGCSLQCYDYAAQLKLKKKRVGDSFRHIGGMEADVNDVIGMENPFHYRNKAVYRVSAKDGGITAGFCSGRSHDVVEVGNCLILHPSINEMYKNNILPLKNLRDFGSVTVRTSFYTGETAAYAARNGKTEVLFGGDHITEAVGGFKFRVSSGAFFQVNPVQTKVLYDKVLEFAGLDRSRNVLDLYCGIGTVTLYCAGRAKLAVGVEIDGAAVQDAERNAKLNNIENAEFINADACGTDFGELPDFGTVILDPPRKGAGTGLLRRIIAIGPERIVYISCDPATLARDAGFLCANGYAAGRVQPVDMFPMTGHVECVAELYRK